MKTININVQVIVPDDFNDVMALHNELSKNANAATIDYVKDNFPEETFIVSCFTNNSSPVEFESYGSKLRNLITPYSILIESLKNTNNFAASVEDFKNHVKYHEDSISKIINFSKNTLLETANYENRQTNKPRVINI